MSNRESLSISVAQVLRRAGVQHPLQRTITLDELNVGAATIPAGTPIELDLVLEATGNAVVATGALRTVARCECRRCLDLFDQPIVTEVREIFDPRPVEGETYPLQAELIDVVPLARDALLLSLPLAPLCRPQCPGPAPEVFPATIEEDAAVAEPAGALAGDAGSIEPEPPRDPRWAALDKLQLDR